MEDSSRSPNFIYLNNEAGTCTTWPGGTKLYEVYIEPDHTYELGGHGFSPDLGAIYRAPLDGLTIKPKRNFTGPILPSRSTVSSKAVPLLEGNLYLQAMRVLAMFRLATYLYL